MPNADVLYPGTMAQHGTGTASSDCTAGQVLVLTGEDEYAPQTDPAGDWDGICRNDAASGAKVTVIVPPGRIRYEELGGSCAAGDEVQNGADGFLTKKTTGLARGRVVKAEDGDNFVELYAIPAAS